MAAPDLSTEAGRAAELRGPVSSTRGPRAAGSGFIAGLIPAVQSAAAIAEPSASQPPAVVIRPIDRASRSVSGIPPGDVNGPLPTPWQRSGEDLLLAILLLGVVTLAVHQGVHLRRLLGGRRRRRSGSPSWSWLPRDQHRHSGRHEQLQDPTYLNSILEAEFGDSPKSSRPRGRRKSQHDGPS